MRLSRLTKAYLCLIYAVKTQFYSSKVKVWSVLAPVWESETSQKNCFDFSNDFCFRFSSDFSSKTVLQLDYFSMNVEDT